MPKNKKYGKGNMSAQKTSAVKSYGRHEGATIGDQYKAVSDLEEADAVYGGKKRKRNKKRMA